MGDHRYEIYYFSAFLGQFGILTSYNLVDSGFILLAKVVLTYFAFVKLSLPWRMGCHRNEIFHFSAFLGNQFEIWTSSHNLIEIGFRFLFPGPTNYKPLNPRLPIPFHSDLILYILL